MAQQVWDGVESQQAAVLRLRKQGGSPSRTIAVSTENLLREAATVRVTGARMWCDEHSL